MKRFGKLASKGFTLIELITVIIVLGVVSVGISGFIRTGVDIYADVTERDQLLGDSRFVVERLNRELRSAIPSSVRVGLDGTTNTQCIEFVPSVWTSYYTSLSVQPDNSTSATIVEFANNPAEFELLENDSAIVYPTSEDDVYKIGNNKRKTIISCSDNGDDTSCSTADNPQGTAKLTLSGAFADHSPASRLYIARNAVSYCTLLNGQIYRQERTISAIQNIDGTGVLMAENLKNTRIKLTSPPFRVFEATLTRNSLVHILLTFERNEEVINYSTEVHIPNAP